MILKFKLFSEMEQAVRCHFPYPIDNVDVFSPIYREVVEWLEDNYGKDATSIPSYGEYYLDTDARWSWWREYTFKEIEIATLMKLKFS